MGWPQYTYLALTLLGLGLVWGKHGEPRDNYNVGTSLLATVISLWLLWAGGFFA